MRDPLESESLPITNELIATAWGCTEMKKKFNHDKMPMVIVVTLIVWAWTSFLSVVLTHA